MIHFDVLRCHEQFGVWDDDPTINGQMWFADFESTVRDCSVLFVGMIGSVE